MVSTSKLYDRTQCFSRALPRKTVAQNRPTKKRGAVRYNLREELQHTTNWLSHNHLVSSTFGRLFSRWAKLQSLWLLGEHPDQPVVLESTTLSIGTGLAANLILSVYYDEKSGEFQTKLVDTMGHFPYAALNDMKRMLALHFTSPCAAHSFLVSSSMSIHLRHGNIRHEARIVAGRNALGSTSVLMATFCVFGCIMARGWSPHEAGSGSVLVGPPIVTPISHIPPRNDIKALEIHLYNSGLMHQDCTQVQWTNWIMAEIAAETLLHRWPYKSAKYIRKLMQQQKFVYINFFTPSDDDVAAWNVSRVYELVVNLVKSSCTRRYSSLVNDVQWNASPSPTERRKQTASHNLKLISATLGCGRALLGGASLDVYATSTSQVVRNAP
jgi:hypothetical protein